MVRLMGFVEKLRRGWISIEVPGTAPPGTHRTYVRYGDDQIPAVPGYLASRDWLRASPVHQDSTLRRAQDGVVRDLTPPALAELPISEALPSDFAGSWPTLGCARICGPQRRAASTWATACRLSRTETCCI
jgi:hypothetical protein